MGWTKAEMMPTNKASMLWILLSMSTYLGRQCFIHRLHIVQQCAPVAFAYIPHRTRVLVSSGLKPSGLEAWRAANVMRVTSKYGSTYMYRKMEAHVGMAQLQIRRM